VPWLEAELPNSYPTPGVQIHRIAGLDMPACLITGLGHAFLGRPRGSRPDSVAARQRVVKAADASSVVVDQLAIERGPGTLAGMNGRDSPRFGAHRCVASKLHCRRRSAIGSPLQETQRLRLGRNTLFAIAALYVVAVAMITVVPMRVTTDRLTRVNVVPLASVAACINRADGPHIPRRCIGNVLGNVLLFVPLGVLFPAITHRYGTPVILVIAASLLATAIEAIQYAERTVPIGRTVDIDDVLWNTLGAYVGFAILRTWRERVGAPPR